MKVKLYQNENTNKKFQNFPETFILDSVPEVTFTLSTQQRIWSKAVFKEIAESSFYSFLANRIS